MASTAPSLQVLAFPAAELMQAQDVPELGEFYDRARGKRLVGVMMADSDSLKMKKFGIEYETVRRTDITEQMMSSYKNSIDKLGINASLALDLMSGKINLQGKVDYLKNKTNNVNSISIVKSARIITHRRSMNAEDLELDSTAEMAASPQPGTIREAINNAVANGSATHVCTEVTYGHYVTMVLTFDNLEASVVEDIDVWAKGVANFNTVQGSIEGHVKIHNEESNRKFSLSVEFKASAPSATLLLPSTPDTGSLYSTAMDAFDATIQAFAQSGKDGASILAFTYTPLEFFHVTPSPSSAVKADLEEQIVRLYADADGTLNRYKRLRADARGRFCPRWQKEVEYLKQCGETLIDELENLIRDVSRGKVDIASVSGYLSTLSNQHAVISRGLRISPLISKRLELIFQRVLELQSRGLVVVSNLAELGRIFNTSEDYLAAVAAVPLFDGSNDIVLYEPMPNGTWEQFRFRIAPGDLSDSVNQTINAVVDVSRTGVNVKGFVVDVLSFAASGVFSLPEGNVSDGTSVTADEFWMKKIEPRIAAAAATPNPNSGVGFSAPPGKPDFEPKVPFKPWYLVSGVVLGTAPTLPAIERGEFLSDIVCVDASLRNDLQVTIVDQAAVEAGAWDGTVVPQPTPGATPFRVVGTYTEFASNAARGVRLTAAPATGDRSGGVSAVRIVRQVGGSLLERALLVRTSSGAPPQPIKGASILLPPLAKGPNADFYLATTKASAEIVEAAAAGDRFLDEGIYTIRSAANPGLFLVPDVGDSEALDEATGADWGVGAVLVAKELQGHASDGSATVPATTLACWRVSRICPYFNRYRFSPVDAPHLELVPERPAGVGPASAPRYVFALQPEAPVAPSEFHQAGFGVTFSGDFMDVASITSAIPAGDRPVTGAPAKDGAVVYDAAAASASSSIVLDASKTETPVTASPFVFERVVLPWMPM